MKSKNFVAKGNREEGLTPITSQWMMDLMESPQILMQLLEIYGSPINIHHMPSFVNNIEGFRTLFNALKLPYKILYARKANKCNAFVSTAREAGIGVDTASYWELYQALELGVSGNNLVLTSAIKTEEQIKLAISNGVTIILDNLDECYQTQDMAFLLKKKALVGFRVSGFMHQGKKSYSRFGFDIDEIRDVVLNHIGTDKKYNLLECVGLHFHLDGYDIAERSTALLQCIEVSKALKRDGYPVSFIDIGGGILLNYLESKKEWEVFNDKLMNSQMGVTPELTVNNEGLGYQLLAGKIVGQLDTYPFYNEVNGPNFVKEVLEFKDSTGKYLHQLLKTNNLEIRIEPGRSLVGQSGITLARVAHRKMDSKGNWLIGLEMNMSQLKSGSRDFLLDPYVLFSEQQESDPVTVLFTGAYCLERDFILKRKIVLPQLPQMGDIVVFVNTAGYMMHFFETEAHLFELSVNLVYDTNKNLPLSLTSFRNDSASGKVVIKDNETIEQS